MSVFTQQKTLETSFVQGKATVFNVSENVDSSFDRTFSSELTSDNPRSPSPRMKSL